jgi:N-acetylmuramoyl-L-alanine amidase
VFALIALIGVLIGAFAVGGDESSSNANAKTILPEMSATTAVEPASSESATSVETPTESTTADKSPLVNATPSAFAGVRGRVIAIDPGHNGGNYLHAAEINKQVNAGTLWKACDTTGTSTNGGYPEAAYNFDVAKRLAKILRKAGAKRVVMTRTTNTGWGPCITERAAIGNRAGADVAISIHADGGPATGRGFHVNYAPSINGLTDDIYKDSRRFALAIRRTFPASGMPPANYIGTDGINVRSDFGGLNLSNVPKVLFESGNMRNSTDAALFKSPVFRQKAALALAHGLNAFLSQKT